MTALQWLEEKIGDKHMGEFLKSLIKQAKEMEKQQIIDAHGDKQKLKSNPGSLVTYGYWYKGEDYYNDNFNKKENGE
jgi:hypothetical protein